MKEYRVSASAQPSIVAHLQTYPETHFGNSQHPLSIWNRSSSKVQKAMIDVLEVLFQAIQDKNKIKDVVPKYELLLHQYSTLINDDASKIIGCFFSDDKAGSKIKQQAKLPNLQAHSSKIINASKHRQREMILVNHFLDDQIIPGFLVVKNDGKGFVLCETIHYKPGDNVFGFYYELRYLFVGIYLLSETLSKLLPLGPTINTPATAATVGRSKILDLFLNLPSLYLPNELKKEMPYIEISPSNNSEEQFSIGVRDKPNIIHKIPVKKMSQETHYTADGITRNFSYYDVY